MSQNILLKSNKNQPTKKPGPLVLIHAQNPPVLLITDEHLTTLVNKFQLNPEFHIVRMPYYDTKKMRV